MNESTDKEENDRRIQYKDFSEWQNAFFNSDEIVKQELYWLERFSGELPILSMPLDYLRPAVKKFDGRSVEFLIENDLFKKLKDLTKSTGTTLYMVLLSAINILLLKYTGQEDIIVGSPIAGRSHADLEDVLGVFVNTLAMRNYPVSTKTYSEFLGEVKENALRAYENQDYQFEDLISKLDINRDMSRTPLFDVVFAMQNIEATRLDFDGLEITGYNLNERPAKFDLEFSATEMDEAIQIDIVYSTSLFREETIVRLGEHLHNLLSVISAGLNIRIGEINILSEAEQNELLYNFNNTQSNFPQEKTIHQLFEEQAIRIPDKVAVVFGGDGMTYQELNTRSNQLAQVLREKGVEPSSIIGIMVERSFEMIIGILGVLKAGGAYLPIDPEYPKDRIRFMLNDSDVSLLLTQSWLADNIAFESEVVILDAIVFVDNVNFNMCSEQLNSLAYIIYTSGSTGKPKGVMVEHKSLINYCIGQIKRLEIDERDRSLQTSSITFDMSVEQIFTTLLCGATLYLIDKDVLLNQSMLKKFLFNNSITYLHVVPSLLETMDLEGLEKLRVIVSGGELCTVSLVQRLIQGRNIKFYNSYGPTEATIISTMYLVDQENIGFNIPIGKPIENSKLYILNSAQKLLPIGVPGELYIGGVGLARGYYKNPDLTKEKFVANPFADGEYMYRTGDLARWLPDGNVEFLGRIDSQVKIRGLRIELGEIESCLLSMKAVREVVVLEKKDDSGDKYLCAYIVVEGIVSSREFREYLCECLPSYMVPAHFVVLDKIPLNPNGKLDRKALPEPETGGEIDYESPRNEMEDTLAKIWSDILGVEKIGIHDNFFESGGHSLKGTALVSKIHKELNLELPLRELFKTPTIAGISKYLEKANRNSYVAIELAEEKEYYEASSAQKRMYALQQLDIKAMSYNMPVVLIIDGYIEIEKWETVVRKLIERHEILRTSFDIVEGKIIQRIHENLIVPLEYRIGVTEYTENASLCIETAVSEFFRPFELDEAPLFRVKLLKLSESKHLLLFDMHHIISDGTSESIFISEFISLYEEKELETQRIQFKDFSEWQNAFIGSERMCEQEKYWLEEFSIEVPLLNMPWDNPRPLIQEFAGGSVRLELGKEMSKSLRLITDETGATLYMVLLSAINILIAKYSNQEDIIIGTPIAGRPHADLENMLGVFVNTLAMRNYPKASKRYDEFLDEVKENALRAYDNQDYQFDELVDKLKLRRDKSRNPLFVVAFLLQNMESSDLKLEGLNFIHYMLDNKTSKFDLTFRASESEEEVVINIVYRTSLFKDETIERIGNHLFNIIRAITVNRSTRLGEIDLLSVAEKSKLLYEYSRGTVDNPEKKMIHQLFEETAKNTPNRVALIFRNESMTYDELNKKANRLARLLQLKGVCKDKVVGIFVEPSFEMIIGILGILKAGGAYFPINPKHSQSLIDKILMESEVDVVLTQPSLRRQITFIRNIVEIDDNSVFGINDADLETVCHPDDLAYVIFSSGNTIHPKKVFIEHKSVVNLLRSMESDYPLNQEDVCLLKTNYTYDVSVPELFRWFMSGSKLVILQAGFEDSPDEIVRVINDESITHVSFVPLGLRAFLDEIRNHSQYKLMTLKYVFVTGESLKHKIVQDFHGLIRNAQLVNLYGLSEAAVYVSKHNVTSNETGLTIPVGKPINNVNLYILGSNMELQPVGVVGELYVGGVCLARNSTYSIKPFAQEFIENPIICHERVFRTGDLARWLPNGEIELLGKIEHQAMIRGLRVDLGLVEDCLLEINTVKNVIVQAFEDKTGTKFLCAFLVTSGDILVSDYKDFLSKKLPDYMIPSYYISLDSLPTNTNGKVDRKALPMPDTSSRDIMDYIAPRNRKEETLVKIWSEVLGEKDVGIFDNFFDLGGDSLNGTTVTSRINKELNAKFTMMELFKTPTIAGVCEYLETKYEDTFESIKVTTKKEVYKASSAQKRMYVLWQMDKGKTNYNMPLIMVVEGTIERNKIEEIVGTLIKRHEILRTSFEMSENWIVQRIHNEMAFSLEYIDNLECSADNIVKNFIRPFNLNKVPLLRVGLVKLEEKKHLLIFDAHHIIADGTSMSILVKEFVELYAGRALTVPNIQYKDFAEWQNNHIESEDIKEQEKYWIDMFSDELPILNFPLDFPRPIQRSFLGRSIEIPIEKDLNKKLKNIAKSEGATLYMVLLSAVNILLSKYTGQEDIIVGSPIAGRPHADLEDMIGMFVNTLAMRNFPNSRKKYNEFLNEVKDNALKSHENQAYQFENLVDKLNLHRDTSRNPVFDVMFSLQNSSVQELELEGLKFTGYEPNEKTANFDMEFTVLELNEKLLIKIGYNTGLFRRETIESLGTSLVNLLKVVTDDEEVLIGEIDILSATERNRILYEFNDTYVENQQEKTIPQLFHEQVEKAPNSTALVFGHNHLTYKELDIRSNQLAKVLRARGAGKNKLISIMVDRSFSMIIGILGILKSGSAYLPIDPEYPQERIRYINENSESEILLTQPWLMNRIVFDGDIVNVEDENIYQKDGDKLELVNYANDLAYVMYTSGSTGLPKGVMVEHSSVVNYCSSQICTLKIGSLDRSLLSATITFDMSVEQIFTPLLCGASLYIIEKTELLDKIVFSKFLKDNAITYLHVVPSLLENLEPDGLDQLKLIVSGGEFCTTGLAEKWICCGNRLFYNSYGPTEATVISTMHCVEQKDLNFRIPIGKPIANAMLYVLDNNLNVLPIGAVGELYISGQGLARGYYNQPELTREKFIGNPYSLGKKMYRTGDLVRWLPDGNLEILGRKDSQVKIRGLRIELGEIENCLQNIEEIKEVVVLSREENGDKYICAYVVSNQNISSMDLRERLFRRLPEYMIPSYFVQLDTIPRNLNGKIELELLPIPERKSELEYEAPRNRYEEVVSEIWTEVLGVKKIGIHDNFFELGGHSLKGSVVAGRIHRELNVELPLKELFRGPTIEEICRYLKNASESAYSSISAAEEKEVYEASPAQKRMYILNKMNPEGTGYNITTAMVIDGFLEKNKVETVVKKLLERHEVLRTSFEGIEDKVVQRIQNSVEFSFVEIDKLNGCIEETINDFIRPFDLSKPPLMRVGLIKQAENKHLLLFDVHHIISDGTSMMIFMKEFLELYEGKTLTGLRIQYKDFSEWQNAYLKSDELLIQEKYWVEKFSGELPILNMSIDYIRPIVRDFSGYSVKLQLGKELSKEIFAIISKTGTTLYMVILSAINIVLSKYTGQEDIIIGTPVAGRQHADLENVLGMFINTLAMRNYPKADITYTEFLYKVKECVLEAFENQSFQFEELVDRVSQRRDMSRNPIFDVMLTLQNIDTIKLTPKGLIFKEHKPNRRVLKFDLEFVTGEIDDEIIIDIGYCTSLFKRETIELLGEHLTNVLKSISKNSEVQLGEINILSEVERNRILFELNNTSIDYPRDNLISQLFEDQVERKPDHVALVFNNKEMTYRELNTRANQLAHLLRRRGVKTDSFVGIIAEHSFEMIIGILGVLKAGGTYVPIDPGYPDDRIRFMLYDSQVSILLIQSWLKKQMYHDFETIEIDCSKIFAGDDSNLEPISHADNLAYVIYTSGSTGWPKGVMIQHKSLTNYIWWAAKTYLNGINESMPLFSSISFDLTITSVFAPLVSGNIIIIYNYREDEFILHRVLKDNKSTVIKLTPTHLSMIKEINIHASNLRKFIVGGEKLITSVAREASDCFSAVEIFNEYGPTETTVGCMVHRYENNRDKGISVPIGRPINNVRIYLLDKKLKIVSTNMVGEIYISGACVSIGYLRQPELTAEKFIESPYVVGELMYRTGDMARRMRDGNVEFLGRIDNQVKIRGFRIELGEIENRILEIDSVMQALVIIQEDERGDHYICAYFSSKKDIPKIKLREYLSKDLPDYMIPSHFIRLVAIPINPNGKVDLALLPKPERKSDVEYHAPRNEYEDIIAKIWTDVLAAAKIGIHDNFFDLGGNSLRATIVMARIHKTLNIEIPLRKLFETPTIAGISGYLVKAKMGTYEEIEAVSKRDVYSVSSAQKRMYVLQHLNPDGISYNIPIALTIDGFLILEKLETAARQLVERHEVLRTSFEIIDGCVVQRIHEDIEFAVEYSENTGWDVEEVIKDFIQPFDLSRAPLLRMCLHKLTEEKHFLLFDIHHIIADGTSMSILVKEFTELYEGKELEAQRIQYKDFSEWQNNYLKSNAMLIQEKYWMERFSGDLPTLNMPLDYIRPVMQDFYGQSIDLKIGKELNEKLNYIAQETGATLYMVLLSIINILLSKYTGQEDIIIGSPVAGRLHTDLENMQGMFVNTLAMRNFPNADKLYIDFLKEVKENAIEAYINQEYQFEELVDKLDLKRDTSRNPLFDVLFVMQNMNTTKLELEGLTFKGYELSERPAKFDLTFTAVELAEEVLINIGYCSALFSRATAERLCIHFCNIIKIITEDQNIYLKNIDILSSHERDRIIHEFNNTNASYPQAKTIHQLFEEQVVKTPNDVAWLFRNTTITYHALNAKANQLARILQDKGVKPGDLVGMMVERSFEMIIGILGILKAGGAYLPIDPEYPDERIRFILFDSEVELCLTQSWLRDRVFFGGEVLELDRCEIYEGDPSNLNEIDTFCDAAYLLYTSGSTGKPKGVLMGHRSVVNRIVWMQKKYPLTQNDVYLQKTTYTFDVSVGELFWCIIVGARGCMMEPGKEKDPRAVVESIKRYQITAVHFVPSMFSMFLDYVDQSKEMNSISTLKRIFTSGEALGVHQVVSFNRKIRTVNKTDLINFYGPTEAAEVTYYDVPIDFSDKIVPIGKPIDNVKIYIFDHNQNISPIGIPGELYISGDSLAYGYYKRLELTSERFVENHFSPGETMYRTGDLARWLPDGNIEFLGRLDNQVKIRGFRIEPEEIENCIRKIDSVKEAVVLAIDDEQFDKYLCAYFVSSNEIPLIKFREQLSVNLPDYMIPTYFMKLDSIPLSPNGKIDRKLLPTPESTSSTVYEAPKNSTEEVLSELWSEVLGIDGIGVYDNFFELGGHSLKGMMLVSKVHKRLNVELPLKELFKTQTIRGISEYLKNEEKSEYKLIKVADAKETFEASSSQKRMFILQQIDQNGTGYNLPVAMKIDGMFIKDRLEVVINKLVRRHEILRTTFDTLDGNLVQRIHQNMTLSIEEFDSRDCSVDRIIKGFIRPFDLHNGPLIRIGYINLSNKEHFLLFDVHHIISDGVSISILVDEFIKLYQGKELRSHRIQYKDFSEWQNAYLKSTSMIIQEQYWMEKFSGELPLLNMPLDYIRPVLQSFNGRNVELQLGKKLCEALKTVTKKTGTTLYMVMLSSISVILSKYTGQDDIIIGSPIAGRSHEDTANMLGMFVNTLAMRTHPKPDMKFTDFLCEVKANALEAYENQEYQFDELVTRLDLQRDMGRTPLFNVMLSMQNIDIAKLDLDGLIFTKYEVGENPAKFDLEFIVTESSKGIQISIRYCTSIFRQETIVRLSEHFNNLLNIIVQDIDVQIGEIDILSSTERGTILNSFNSNDVEYSQKKTIQRLFEEQVDKTPNNIALEFGDDHMTYKELNKKSNQLARKLRKKGVKPDSIVGIMVERSFEMIIGIIGILKAGGAYLPIDPKLPKERLCFILKNSEVEILLTQTWTRTQDASVYDIIELDNSGVYEGDDTNLEVFNCINDLAYVIYTSGSTGTPKGVMVEHESVINLLQNMETFYPLEKEDSYLLKTSYTFDVSVLELFSWFITGAKLVILHPGYESLPKEIINVIYERKITHINFVPTMLNVFLEEIKYHIMEKTQSLKYVFSAGETLKQETVWSFYKNLKNTRLENIYGPTESTVYVSRYSTTEETQNQSVPIGKPFSNVQFFILCQNLNVQPIGIAGELCISGNSLARGYLNHPELTSEKFIMNPLYPNKRMYRTGDLARWLPDGNVEFLGRMDNQIKLRGYRIELGEIESQILKISEVMEAIVLLMEDKNNEKLLCAYVVTNKSIPLNEYREKLSESLPDHMIPSCFIQLNAIPLNPSGKIDRKLLPMPEGPSFSEYEAPRNKMEEIVSGIWSEVLGIENIGIYDNFFELGGHSLKGTAITSRIHKTMNIELPLHILFKAPTIAGVSDYLGKAKINAFSSIESIDEREFYEVSSAQKRMYVLQQLEPDGIGYNMPAVIIINGFVDIRKIEMVFRGLVERHEVLRTSFKEIDEKIVQCIHKNTECLIEHIESQDMCIDNMVKDFIRPFNLSVAPLLRVGLAKLDDEKYILLFDIHHIISDGISMSILVKEFTEFYRDRTLSTQRIQYKDFSTWQNSYLKSDDMLEQEKYWLEKFSNEIPALNMALDFQRPSMQEFSGQIVELRIDNGLCAKLKTVLRKTGTTLYMVLLSAINVLLSKHTGQEDIIIGSPIAGRPHSDLENILGVFVNTLAMRNYPIANKTYKEFLFEVKENALSAFEHQTYPFEKLVDKLNLRRDMSRNPLFDVMFSMQNAETFDLSLEDLSFSRFEPSIKTAKFDLEFTASELREEILISIGYCTSLFERETIERLSEHLYNLIKIIADDIDIRLGEIDILSETERNIMLYEFNKPYKDYPRDKTLHQLFEEQVEKSPNKVAIVFDGKRMTYGELNRKANLVARALQSKGVGRNQLIGIMVERSFDMVVGVFGVLKAGCAYLPIDPEYPTDRIGFILKDSNVSIILTQSWINVRGPKNQERLFLDDNDLNYGDESNLGKDSSSNDLAYVIYTSGSTGKPKGVMVEHKSVVNLSLGQIDRYKINENDRVLQFYSICFDPFVQQLFITTLSGASLYLIEKNKLLDRSEFNQYIEENKITHLDIVPSFLDILNNDKISSLKRIILGGEVCTRTSIEKLKKRNHVMIYNEYGLTETTVTASMFVFDQKDIVSNIPIGKPITNSKAYILNEEKKLLPIGIIGELYIGGEILARGYLNHLELTNEKFVESPFISGERLCRTGDLARWRPDGNLEFFGRIDNQIKIRGYRIELREIEKYLLKIENVEDAIVLPREDENGEQSLCAYLVSKIYVSTSELRGELSKQLPAYMVPSHFIYLDDIPLDVNGKINRDALTKIEIQREKTHMVPRSVEENIVANAFSAVLGIKDIGADDDFFLLGGDSIKAIRIVSKLREAGYELRVRDLIVESTVEMVSTKLIKCKDVPEYDQGDIEGLVPLTPIQKWFFTANFANLNHFNQSIMLKTTERIETAALSLVLDEVVKHHDILRAVYQSGTQQILSVEESTGYELFEYDYRNDDVTRNELSKIIKDINCTIQESINIECGPMMKVGLFKTVDADHIMICVHHLVVDGVSWRILIEDIELGYRQYIAGEIIKLSEKTASYHDWSKAILEYSESTILMNEVQYWNDIVKSVSGGSFQKTDTEEQGTGYLGVELDEEYTNKLLYKSCKAFNTEINDLLLSSLGIAIRKLTGQKKISVNVEGHGREELHKRLDIDRTIGWFTSVFPVNIELFDDIKDMIITTKEMLHRVPQKGLGYGVLRYISRMYLEDEEARLTFNYLGSIDSEIDVNGSLFEVSEYNRGQEVSDENQSKDILTINCIIAKEKLKVGLSYRKDSVAERDVKRFGDLYIESIIGVIKTCIEQEQPVRTPSDFGLSDEVLSQGDLEKILKNM